MRDIVRKENLIAHNKVEIDMQMQKTRYYLVYALYLYTENKLQSENGHGFVSMDYLFEYFMPFEICLFFCIS